MIVIVKIKNKQKNHLKQINNKVNKQINNKKKKTINNKDNKKKNINMNKIKMITFICCMKVSYCKLNKSLIIPKYIIIQIFDILHYFEFDTSILKSIEQKQLLTKWIKEINKKSIPKNKVQLLYRATEYKFDPYKYHELCDDKQFKIILAEANGYIFGGFTTKIKKSNAKFIKNDKDSFIFSITNPLNLPIKVKKNDRYLAGFYTFGMISFADDLHIDLKFDVASYPFGYLGNSYSTLGESYTDFPFQYKSNEIDTFLCGKKDFNVSQVEIFQLI